MKKRTKVIIIGIIFVLGVASAWILRGVYDEIYMFEGRFHVINHVEQPRQISLLFPSGIKKDVELQQYGFQDINVPSTGEGSIGISVNGKFMGNFGYVTTMNGIVVISVDEKTVSISRISQKSSDTDIFSKF